MCCVAAAPLVKGNIVTRLKSIFAGLASFAMVAAPVAASANPAAPLSVSSSVRASADKGESDFAAPGSIIGLVLFAAIVAGGIILIATSDNDSPASR